MLSVLIADDEKKVGLLIKNLIEWERLGLNFLGLVQDGESAYDIIMREKPDIVITDIRMPKLTGLEMIERVSASGRKVHFIVVSGYRYFEYAQRALKYGVKDYLLKPIDEVELNKILEKVYAEETQKQNLENKMETLEKDLFYSRHMLHKELMEKAFSERREDEGEEKGLMPPSGEDHMGRGHFQAIALKVDRDIARGRDMAKEGLMMQKLSEKAEESLQTLTIDLVISVKSGMWLMLLLNFREDHSDSIQEALTTMFYAMRDYISSFEGCVVTMGCSPVITEFSKINLILEISREAAERRIFEGCGKCIENYGEPLDPETASKSWMDIISGRRGQMKEDISIFRTGDLGRMIKECFEEAGKISLMASEYYGMGHGLITEYAAIVLELFQTETEKAPEWQDAVEHCRTVSSLQKYVKDILKEDLEAVRKRREELERKPVLNAIRYVQENYGQKILLEDIAEMAGFNASYFSEIFKKETGKNFTAFLLEVRIEESKAMLRDTNKTVYEIAADVGYKDAKFFSQQFTKTVGIKPKEYRRLYY